MTKPRALLAKKEAYVAKHLGVDAYLAQTINFGGELMSLGEAIATLQSEGHPQKYIDRWIQGAMRLRE